MPPPRGGTTTEHPAHQRAGHSQPKPQAPAVETGAGSGVARLPLPEWVPLWAIRDGAGELPPFLDQLPRDMVGNSRHERVLQVGRIIVITYIIIVNTTMGFPRPTATRF